MDSPTLCPNLSQKKAQLPFDGAKPCVGRCEPGRLGSRTEAAGWSQVSAEKEPGSERSEGSLIPGGPQSLRGLRKKFRFSFQYSDKLSSF